MAVGLDGAEVAVVIVAVGLDEVEVAVVLDEDGVVLLVLPCAGPGESSQLSGTPCPPGAVAAPRVPTARSGSAVVLDDDGENAGVWASNSAA